MRTWRETRLSSFPFPIIAGSTCVAVSAECRRLMRDAIKACLVGFKEKDATSWEAKSYGREKRCLWSLSKWGAFARLGRGGENEWEASYEADRHTCRWIIWQRGQMLHHCSVHVQPSHPPRSKWLDPVQLHIRLINLSWWESCNTSIVCLKVVWRRMSPSPAPPGVAGAALTPHAISLGANWHREHQGAPPRTAAAGEMIPCICQTLWWEWSVLPWERSSSGKRRYSSNAKCYGFIYIYIYITQYMTASLL